MFKRVALALSAAAAVIAVPTAAQAQGYYGGYYPSYGYSYPSYGYAPGYSYGYSYPSYGYYGSGYPSYGYNGYGYGGYGYNGAGSNVGAALIGGVIGLAIGSAISNDHHHHHYYRRYR